MTSRESIQSIFERTSFRYPEQTAIIYENNSVSYRQLNEKANQLAHFYFKIVIFKISCWVYLMYPNFI